MWFSNCSRIVFTQRNRVTTRLTLLCQSGCYTYHQAHQRQYERYLFHDYKFVTVLFFLTRRMPYAAAHISSRMNGISPIGASGSAWSPSYTQSQTPWLTISHTYTFPLKKQVRKTPHLPYRRGEDSTLYHPDSIRAPPACGSFVCLHAAHVPRLSRGQLRAELSRAVSAGLHRTPALLGQAARLWPFIAFQRKASCDLPVILSSP